MVIKPLSSYSVTALLSGLMVLIAFSCTYNEAAEVAPEALLVSYKEDIQPILATHCYSCHTPASTDADKPGYAFLDNFEELKRYALSPSTSNASLTKLQARIRFVEFPGMPFKQAPLEEKDIRQIEAWIKAGAPNN